MFPKNLTYSVDTYVMSKAPERIGIWGLFLTSFWHILVTLVKIDSNTTFNLADFQPF